MNISARAQFIGIEESSIVDINKSVNCVSLKFVRAPYLSENVPSETVVYTRSEDETTTYRDILEDLFIYFKISHEGANYVWRYGGNAELVSEANGTVLYKGGSNFGDIDISFTPSENGETLVHFTISKNTEFLFSLICH